MKKITKRKFKEISSRMRNSPTNRDWLRELKENQVQVDKGTQITKKIKKTNTNDKF